MKWVLTALAALLIAGAGYCWHLGYFGGPVFTNLRPANPQKPFAAVVLSGDMGFEIGMGPAIAKRLAADGIATVGVNSLTVFRHRRTPDDVARLVATAAGRALALGHASRVVLIGQSFGADMLHVGLAGASPGLRRRIALVALVVPENSVQFRASPSELFDLNNPDADALPTARRIDWVPLLCVQGAEETNSLCPLLHGPNVTRVALPGGHPMHRDVDALYTVLSRAIDATWRRD